MTRRSWLPSRFPVLLIGLVLAIAGVALAPLLLDDGDRTAERTVVYALGDGADGSAQSARLADYVIAADPDRFLYLGDVYETGTPEEFARNYEPLYGALGDRTDPVIGNHEYMNREQGYYPYWFEQRGWDREEAKHRAYVDEASGWQLIAYSSETNLEAEAEWVAGQLDAHEGTCRIAFAHKGRYAVAAANRADNPEQEPIWRALAGRTAINLIAHSHVHGRLRPIDGVTVVVSGAGGHALEPLGDTQHPLAAAGAGTPTATRLVLDRGRAELRQVDASGEVHDRATIPCEPAPGT